MKVLITGSSGLVGRSIKQKLQQQKHQLQCPSHQTLDLTQYHDVKQYFKTHTDIETVIHCAAAHPHYWEEGSKWGRKLNDDITMALNLLRLSPHIILLTSGSLYGMGAIDDIKEDDFQVGRERDEVGWPKFVISTMAHTFPNVLELRPFGIFGPGEPSRRLITYCFEQILHDQPIIIQNDREISHIYVEDLCNIIVHFLMNPSKHRVFNVAYPISVRVTEMAHMCMVVAQHDVPLQIEAEGEPYTANIDRLLDEFPTWAPMAYSQALLRVYEYVKEQKEI